MCLPSCRREIGVLLNLFSAQVHMGEWEYLPSLMQLVDAQNRLNKWMGLQSVRPAVSFSLWGRSLCTPLPSPHSPSHLTLAPHSPSPLTPPHTSLPLTPHTSLPLTPHSSHSCTTLIPEHLHLTSCYPALPHIPSHLLTPHHTTHTTGREETRC